MNTNVSMPAPRFQWNPPVRQPYTEKQKKYAGKLGPQVLKASNLSKFHLTHQILFDLRTNTLNERWEFQHHPVQCGQNYIDAVVAWNKKASGATWMVHALGNCQFFEREIQGGPYALPIAKKLKAHLVLFNYASVGFSSGLPDCEEMANSYESAIHLAKNMGAKRLILSGFSIGGGILAKVLPNVEWPEMQTIFIRTFFELTALAASQMGEDVKKAIHAIHWNLEPGKVLLESKYPYTVIQTGDPEKKVSVNDRIINADNTLATYLNNAHPQKNDENVIFTPGDHSAPLSKETLDLLANRVQNNWRVLKA